MEKISQVQQKLSEQSKQYQQELMSEISASIEKTLKEYEQNLIDQSKITQSTIEAVTKRIGTHSDKKQNPSLFQYIEWIAKKMPKKEETIFSVSLMGYTFKITKE